MVIRTRRLAGMVGALVLTATGIAVTSSAVSTSANAASCYGGAVNWLKGGGTHYYPSVPGQRLVTGPNCGDINLRMVSGGRYVKVCFHPRSGPEYCQANYTWAPKNTWTVIARNVADGTQYYFRFVSTTAGGGQYAD